MGSVLHTASPAAKALAKTLTRLASTDLPLLLEGETGCGKSWLAARIHRHSRAGQPLVVVDCGALPASLAAVELFGHAAGAFTDAGRGRRGWLEQAGGGTLVFDRIEALSPEAQVTLLRTLEERRFVPVGGLTARPLRARVIATATDEVSASLESGRLRRDLYHRLAGYHAHIPPLRARREDILPACAAYLRRQSRLLKTALTLHAECAELVLNYPWPGNFRELEASLQRGCLSATSGLILPHHLSLPSDGWERVAAWAAQQRRCLAEVTRSYALWVLAEEGGNVSRAARVLGVSRRTLIRWRGKPHG